MIRLPASSRLTYLAGTVVTIAVGLCVYFGHVPTNRDARDVLGDALWAVMIAWLVGLVAPRVSLGARSLAALSVCWLVELSQLIHTHVLDAVRGTTVGHLILGSGFDPRDLVSYALGVAVALGLEWLARGARGALWQPAD